VTARKTPPLPRTDANPPTMAEVFHHMLKRDEDARDSLFQLAQQMGSLTTVVEGTQQELQRLVRLQEQQAEYNSRQIAMAEKTIHHEKTFERAFTDIERITGNLDNVTKTLASYAGSLNTIKLIVGAAIALGASVTAFAYGVVVDSIADARGDAMTAIAAQAQRHDADTNAATLARDQLRDQLRDVQERLRKEELER
jgi:hypothetical protein